MAAAVVVDFLGRDDGVLRVMVFPSRREGEGLYPNPVVVDLSPKRGGLATLSQNLAQVVVVVHLSIIQAVDTMSQVETKMDWICNMEIEI